MADWIARLTSQRTLEHATLLGTWVGSWWLFLTLRESLLGFYATTDEQWYLESSFVGASLLAGAWPLPWMLLCAGAILAARWIGWSSMATGRQLRWFAGIVALVFAWTLSLYEYNFFFDRLHAFDRAIVCLSAFGVFVSPAFLPLLVVAGFLSMAQFTHPLGVPALSLTDKRIVYEILVALSAWLPVHLILSRVRSRITSPFRLPDDGVLIFSLLCLVGASYYVPGLEKLRMAPHWHEWLTDNDLSMLVHWGLVRGWMRELGPDFTDALLQLVSRTSPFLLTVALLTELAGILLLSRRWLAAALLANHAMLHVMIFLSCGLFFWKWVVADAALSALLVALPRERRDAIFTLPIFAFSVLVIATAPYHVRPIALGWFDGNTDYRFEIELETADGERAWARPKAVAPYDIIFSFDRFTYLIDEPFTKAGKSYERLLAIREAGPEGSEEIHRQFGKNRFDPDKVDDFDRFVTTYFDHRNDSLGRPDPFRSLSAPPHVWNFRPEQEEALDLDAPVAVLRLWMIENYFRGTESMETRRRVAREVRLQGLDVSAQSRKGQSSLRLRLSRPSGSRTQ
ncbi:MAG: hypothetical protein QNK05_23790 [Myxococcota bacterium]|nr:hypothetical protein [Myxococcota bacterium]